MKGYVGPVQTLAAKLLLLLAVLLMPLGMASAAATVPAPDHQSAMAGMVMQHCPEQTNKRHGSDTLAPCSMACASALPAQDAAHGEAPRTARQVAYQVARLALRGIETETSTPPPKTA